MRLAAVAILVAGSLGSLQLPHKRPASARTVLALHPTRVLDEPRSSRWRFRSPLPAAKKVVPLRASRPEPRAGSGDRLDWRALSYCESSGNPRAVDPSGTYFGLYQFDLGTWRSVGGQGNPADASPTEQTYRAQLLYAQRGRAPWPVCGVHL